MLFTIRSFHKGIKYECSECKKLFTSKENLELHQKATHDVGNDIDQDFEHIVQDPNFESKHHLSEGDDISSTLDHVLTEEQHSNKLPNNSSDSQKNFSCDQCEKLFETKEMHDLHLKMAHDRDKLFICTSCNKNFTQQAALKHHLSIHEVKK